MSKTPQSNKLDAVVAKAQRDRQSREQGYRAKALKMYPWVCGRCMREFTQANLQELTVHHRNHDHDYNPQDGTNWELLCLYCHDNEHSRYLDAGGDVDSSPADSGPANNPFANLKKMLGNPSD
jgi:hypothetical protein